MVMRTASFRFGLKLAPPADEILGCATPVRKVKIETGLEETGWYDTPALQDKFRFCTQQDSTDGQRPRGNGQTEIPRTPGVTKAAHELPVGQWTWGANVYGCAELFVLD